MEGKVLEQCGANGILPRVFTIGVKRIESHTSLQELEDFEGKVSDTPTYTRATAIVVGLRFIPLSSWETRWLCLSGGVFVSPIQLPSGPSQREKEESRTSCANRRKEGIGPRLPPRIATLLAPPFVPMV